MAKDDAVVAFHDKVWVTTMKLEHAISINAPPNVVWDVAVDVERWPEWTPSVTSVKRIDQGPFEMGSVALIKQPGLPAAEWTVTALTRGEQFTWESRRPGLRMIGSHGITATDGGAQSRLRIDMFGVVARLLWPLIRFSVQRALEQENTGLKKRCEAVGSSS